MFSYDRSLDTFFWPSLNTQNFFLLKLKTVNEFHTFTWSIPKHTYLTIPKHTFMTIPKHTLMTIPKHTQTIFSQIQIYERISYFD